MAEKPLTIDQLAKVEEKMKTFMADKKSWVKRYGKDAEKVMRGRAINTVKKETKNMNKQTLKELVRKALMQEQDIEAMADRIGGEETLGKASTMLDALESALKSHDWWYMMSDDDRAYQRGLSQQSQIRSIINNLKSIGYEDEAKELYNQYAPSRLALKETAKFSKKYDDSSALKGSQKKLPDALQKSIIAKKKVKEDLDLGHEDNEPHMVKGELYKIGKYAMELYQMVDKFEGQGEVDFPAWWQAKITQACSMISSAKHYLEFELKEPEIDAMVDVAQAEDVLSDVTVVNEGLPKGFFKKEFGIGGKKKVKEGSYPFDKCLKDQTPKYGEEGAKRVCGSIKAAYGEGLEENSNKTSEYSDSELSNHIKELMKKRARAASEGKNDIVNKLSKEINKANNELKKRS